MDNDSNTFYVQVSNFDSSAVCVENNHSCFRSKLPKALHLKDKWSVALSRIYLTPKIMNIANPINTIELETRPSDSDDLYTFTKHVTKVVIPPTLCTTVTHLILILNTSMLETGVVFNIDNENICCIYERKSQSDMIYQLKLHNKTACILAYKRIKYCKIKMMDM